MAEKLTFYGTSGLIDMPNAQPLADGDLAFTVSKFGPTLRNTMTFQITPRLQGSFRYTQIENYDDNGTEDRFDRSFDLSYLLLRESATWPGIAVGIRDFGGTGTFSGEFLVASKSITPTVTVTGGLGWGRLGSRNGFDNPLSVLDDRFLTRPASGTGDINTTGQLDYKTWFRGDAAVFGGVDWQINDAWSVVAEYSSDVYALEEQRGVFTQKSPLNFGVNYAFDNGVNVGAYYLYGAEAGLRVNYVLDPDSPTVAGSRDPAPATLLADNAVAAASWNQTPSTTRATEIVWGRLQDEGLSLDGLALRGSVADLRITNTRFDATPQALGRAARILSNTLPPRIDTFDITFMANGLPLSTTRLRRADMQELEYALDGTWQSFARAEISDAHDLPADRGAGPAYPRFNYDYGYYIIPALFDPDAPVRVEFGAQLDLRYAIQPNLILSGRVRQEVGGNLSDATRRSNSVVQRVRSESFEYARQSQTELTHLTGEYFFRPGQDMFGRVSAGYLEQMFAGVSAEVLWYPIDSPLALGAELNYAAQRDFDGGLGFRDYDVVTGHASAYYDFGNSFRGQLDVGRYLAGDWGGTMTLSRSFNNGFTVGAFMTLTDMPFEDFGEGSFDKGLWVSIPSSWLVGQSSGRSVSQVLRPVLRDGGARLDVRNRLYGLTDSTRADALADEWGRFWR